MSQCKGTGVFSSRPRPKQARAHIGRGDVMVPFEVFNVFLKNDRLMMLLQAIAYHLGSQVGYSKLAQAVGIDGKTVEAPQGMAIRLSIPQISIEFGESNH